MEEIKRVERINRLLDLYGRLLTKSQLEIMSDYYYCDLSLSEIAQLRNISRTAVSDSINKSIIKLENYEEKLQLCQVFDSQKNGKNKDVVNKIEEMIKDGI